MRQICLSSIISNVTNNKKKLWKTVRLKSFERPIISRLFNLLQVYPSASTSIFAVLFILSFNALIFYFYVSLHVETIRKKYLRDTALNTALHGTKKIFFFFRRNSKPTAETSYTLRRQNMRWQHGLRNSSSLLWQTRFEMQSGDQNMLQVGDMSRGRWEWGSPFLVNGSKLARCWSTFKWLFGTARIRKRQLLPIRMPVVNTSISDKSRVFPRFHCSRRLQNSFQQGTKR